MNVSKITKDQILKSAAQIARDKGLQHLNIREVAALCKVSIGSIYNYFPDKSALVISVIESFWKQACTLEDMKQLQLTNFTESYAKMYNILYAYFHQFENEWMFQLQNLDEKTKQLGRRFEESYYQDIRNMLNLMIEHDTTLSNQLWDTTFTKDAFILFVFSNTLNLLKQNVKEPAFFIATLSRLLTA